MNVSNNLNCIAFKMNIYHVLHDYCNISQAQNIPTLVSRAAMQQIWISYKLSTKWFTGHSLLDSLPTFRVPPNFLETNPNSM